MSALASNLSFSFPATKTSRLVPVHGFLLKKKSHNGQNSGRPPLRNVRAYKVQVGPIETVDHCHVTANGRPPACPATFILSATGEHSASSRFKPYLTLHIPTLRGGGRDRIWISRKQIFSVRMFENSDSVLCAVE
jgi:hypothetical protein